MDELVIVVLYEKQHQVTEALFEAIAASECQKLDIQFLSVGENYQTATIVLSGSWSQMTRFRTRFSIIKQRFSIQSILQSISPIKSIHHALPYEAYLNMPASASLLNQTMQFFTHLGLRLQRISVTTYQAAITNTLMFEIGILLIIPIGKSINDYRENILQFCDDNNFEVILEFKRN